MVALVLSSADRHWPGRFFSVAPRQRGFAARISLDFLAIFDWRSRVLLGGTAAFRLEMEIAVARTKRRGFLRRLLPTLRGGNVLELVDADQHRRRRSSRRALWRAVRQSRSCGFVDFGRTLDRIFRFGVLGKRQLRAANRTGAYANIFGFASRCDFVCRLRREPGGLGVVVEKCVPRELFVFTLAAKIVVGARVVRILSATGATRRFVERFVHFAGFSSESNRAQRLDGATTWVESAGFGVFLARARFGVCVSGAVWHWRFGRA